MHNECAAIWRLIPLTLYCKSSHKIWDCVELYYYMVDLSELGSWHRLSSLELYTKQVASTMFQSSHFVLFEYLLCDRHTYFFRLHLGSRNRKWKLRTVRLRFSSKLGKITWLKCNLYWQLCCINRVLYY